MDQEKYLKLLQMLIKKTTEDKIPWKKTGSSDWFVAPISSTYSVILKHYEGEYGDDDYSVVISNSSGETIKSLSSDELQEFIAGKYALGELDPIKSTLGKLFSSARRKAFGADKA